MTSGLSITYIIYYVFDLHSDSGAILILKNTQNFSQLYTSSYNLICDPINAFLITIVFVRDHGQFFQL